MSTLTVKEYAVKYRLPIYNVVKMAKNGELPTEKRQVDGKDELFIVTDEAPALKTPSQEATVDYKKAYFELKAKYDKLLKQKG
ncbi:MAG: hypothetical protein U9Q62_03605 [Campylobacterota bacterium]|nr:hypothetical protein [Campylobacterota bacterium]